MGRVQNPLFFPVDLTIAVAYALLVLVLVVAYRRAGSMGARMFVYLISVILVLAFLILFAPR